VLAFRASPAAWKPPVWVTAADARELNVRRRWTVHWSSGVLARDLGAPRASLNLCCARATDKGLSDSLARPPAVQEFGEPGSNEAASSGSLQAEWARQGLAEFDACKPSAPFSSRPKSSGGCWGHERRRPVIQTQLGSHPCSWSRRRSTPVMS